MVPGGGCVAWKGGLECWIGQMEIRRGGERKGSNVYAEL
jgi:hypothetical protein